MPFIARIASSFENAPAGERLYEVVSPEGGRVASTMSELQAANLAGSLNAELARWAERVGADAVIE
jgi:hypothetical protein